MGESRNRAIERVKIREVAGVFHSRDALAAAMDALLLAGFDRADVAFLVGDEARERLAGIDLPIEEVPEVPGVPRHSYLAPEDLIAIPAIVLGIATFIVAAGAAGWVIASGGSPGRAGAAAAVAALAVGCAAAFVIRVIRRKHARKLNIQLPAGDCVLCVRVRSPDQEQKAQQLLLGHGADAVRPHEIEIEKRLEDLPLHSLRVDPWLGDEPLARP